MLEGVAYYTPAEKGKETGGFEAIVCACRFSLGFDLLRGALVFNAGPAARNIHKEVLENRLINV